ncbi:M28 family metallopeptidase [Planococcus shenhongbingii]|uniref:M28 family peptidase n=1 Tax=Planococcus shenhongbingii TaxID=3058398 RepID=A0ABT8NEA2_9BACL|nr:M28 family metallopeptidase [Planococcus sp. N017]MDN7246156.1 M28 family peptidase [Planococcus sp. N017]
MQTTEKLSAFENELRADVSKKGLMEFTKEIAKEVRLSGSEEELRAFEYAKSQLESFGLQTELLFSDAYISIPLSASLHINGKEFDCITHAMSKPVKDLVAEIVDLGNGSEEAYQSNNVKGKVALIDGLATPAGVQKAASYGVAAVLFVNARYTHEMIVSPVWGTPVPKTVPYLPNTPVVSVNFENGQSIRKEIQDKRSECRISTEVDTGFRSIPTLTAEIKGSEEPEKFVMFSGHIDSWHYGVMDNGTANAVMLEVARILSQHPEKLKRTLRLAFWSGHSHGRYAGSAWYCDTHWEELHENCVLHVNVDSVGAKDAVVLTEANCMKETQGFAKEVIGTLTGEEYEGSRFGRAGDQSFWGTGTPSIFMGLSEQVPSDEPAAAAFKNLFGGGKAGGFGWWWHTTEDTIDKIDPDFLKRDCEIYLILVYRALTNPLIPVNILEGVKEIEEGLTEWHQKAQGRFDLSVAVERAQQLKQSTEKFQHAIAGLESEDKERISWANETIMELSRILVPLNYVKGNIFDHDFALKQPVIPKLAELDQLLQAEKDSNEFQFLYTSLLRSRNEVNFALKKASQAVEQVLQRIV